MSDADVELAAGFFVRQGAEDLAGEFVSRQLTSQELGAGFTIRTVGTPQELLGNINVTHSEALPARFIVSRAEWISQGLNVAVYQALGIVS